MKPGYTIPKWYVNRCAVRSHPILLQMHANEKKELLKNRWRILKVETDKTGAHLFLSIHVRRRENGKVYWYYEKYELTGYDTIRWIRSGKYPYDFAK